MTKSDFLQLQELQRNSGLTLMKYLRENGLSYSTYNYWKRKFLYQESEESEVPFAQVCLRPSTEVAFNNGSRSGTVIEELTKGYKGYFQCDGFEGYESAFKTRPDVLIVNCMAHIRRHFEQAQEENKEMAEHALKEIQLLYRVEHE